MHINTKSTKNFKNKYKKKNASFQKSTIFTTFLKFSILLIITFVSSSSVISIGVLPALKEYDDSNTIIKTTIYFRNEDTTNYEVSLSTSGELAKYAKLSKTSFESRAISDTEIECEINIDGVALSYGSNSLYINFLAKPKDSSDYFEEQITAVPAVTARISINVPYPGKYLDLTLGSVSTKTKGLISLTLLYSNKGEEKIEKLLCTATLLDDENQKVLAELQRANIINGNSGELTLDLYGNFSSGDYPLYIECNFDGEKKIFEESVQILGQAVDVVSAKIENGMYNITVKNRGRAEYSIVYATVILIDENNNEVANFNTVPQTLAKSGTVNLEGFSGFDAEKLNITNGKILLKLNYDNFQSDYKFNYEPTSSKDLEAEKKAKSSVWYIVFIIAILVIAFLIVRSIAKNKEEY